MRAFLRTFFTLLFKLISRLEIQGLENIPAQGGCILAVNHLHILDAPLVFSLLERTDATGLVADKHKKNPFLRWIVNGVHGVWINREDADLQALRVAREYLEQGGMLGIAPEGTRSRSGMLIPAKTGVAYLAEKANVPIVPIALWGTETTFSMLRRLQRSVIHVHIGKPFYLPPLDRKDRTAAMQRNTEELMCRIAAMLPPQYRGAYAGHPRLPEYLSSE